MRVTRCLVAVGAATAVLAADQPSSTTQSVFSTSSVPVANVTCTAAPNATTSSTPAQATGGAIPQQMQASMAGLLGFCIVGLVML